MHLVELLSYRPVPAAGVSLGLTRRCPLHCAHCSTNSTMSSEQASADMFIRFVGSFTRDDHPHVMAMSGGEAMLRPRLVQKLAGMARAAGTRTIALSGMFFARSATTPCAIRDAIRAVDHFSVSLDAFHEREVPRANVFRVLDELLAEGIDTSIHIAGMAEDDPYLEEVIGDIRHTFGERVPMMVNVISSFGRAKAWLQPRTDKTNRTTADREPNPCAIAAWPVVGFNGTIAACANDDVLEDIPPHLRLGHAAVDDWPTVRARTLGSSMMRGIRLFGPEYLSFRTGGDVQGCSGICQTCMRLSQDPAVEQRVADLMARPAMGMLERQVTALQQRAGAVAFAARHGLPRYAELVALGAPA